MLPSNPRESNREEPVRNRTRHRNTVGREVEQLYRNEREDDHDQRAGQGRKPVSHQQQRREARGSERERRETGVGKALDGAPQLLHVAPIRLRHAKQLVRLLDDDPDRKAEDEATHHRLGQEVRHPAHASETERHVHESGCEGQGSREPCRVIRSQRCGAHQGRDHGRHDGRDGGARSLRHLLRRAEHGVAEEGCERGVEPMLDGHAGDRRVGQRLRDEERPDRDACHRVRPEPGPLVAGQPVQDGNGARDGHVLSHPRQLRRRYEVPDRVPVQPAGLSAFGGCDEATRRNSSPELSSACRIRIVTGTTGGDTREAHGGRRRSPQERLMTADPAPEP